MTPKRGILFVLLVLGLMLASLACSASQAAPISSPTASQTPPGLSSLTYFPVQKLGYEGLAYPSALAQGELILDNGYLRLKPSLVLDKTSRGLLIIWPPGSTWQIENDQVQVINPAGKSIARVGETLRVGGGEISAEIVAKYTGQAPPDGCESPYWLSAPGVYTAPPSTPPPGPPLTEEMKENPQLLPATAYANHHGITIDEAFNRLDIQNSFGEIAGKLDTELSTQEAGTYGGLWLQHQPEFKIVVAFTRDGEETLKKYYFEDLEPFLPYLEVRTVKFSQAELENAQNQITSVLRDLDIPCDSATHIIENCVDIRVSESMRTRVEEAIRSSKLVVPESVRINYAGGLARPV